MLEKSKKVLIDICLRLKLIKYKEDKDERTLTRFSFFIELFIAQLIFYWLNDIVGNTFNFNLKKHFFITLITLFTLIVLVSYPLHYLFNRIITLFRNKPQ